MQRHKRCCNPPPVLGTWTQDVLEGKRKRTRKTPLERISLPTPFPLTCLVGNSHLPPSRLLSPTQRRTKTTSKEVLGVEKADKDKVVAATPLQRELTLTLSREKRETSSKSSASPVIERDIIRTNVPRIRIWRENSKTSVSLGNLHAGDWNKVWSGWDCQDC